MLIMDTNFSLKTNKNICDLIPLALSGDMQSKHAAALYSGGKRVAIGINHAKSCKKNKPMLSCHAEMHALQNYLLMNNAYYLSSLINDSVKSMNQRKNFRPIDISRYKFLKKKLSMYVVRVTKDGSLANSKPCSACRYYLKLFNVKDIIYTDDNGNLIKEKVDDLEDSFVSIAHFNYSEYLKGNCSLLFPPHKKVRNSN